MPTGRYANGLKCIVGSIYFGCNAVYECFPARMVIFQTQKISISRSVNLNFKPVGATNLTIGDGVLVRGQFNRRFMNGWIEINILGLEKDGSVLRRRIARGISV